MESDESVPDWDIVNLDSLHGEARREDWARSRVAAAGKSWATHLTKFDGTVLPR